MSVVAPYTTLLSSPSTQDLNHTLAIDKAIPGDIFVIALDTTFAQNGVYTSLKKGVVGTVINIELSHMPIRYDGRMKMMPERVFTILFSGGEKKLKANVLNSIGWMIMSEDLPGVLDIIEPTIGQTRKPDYKLETIGKVKKLQAKRFTSRKYS